MTKDIKIPMIVAIVLYGVALLIDLCGVILQKWVLVFMGAPGSLEFSDGFVFPITTVFQIICMIMYIVFFLIMLRYKGSEKRIIGIVMIVIYCVLTVLPPYIQTAVTRFDAVLGESVGYVITTATLTSFRSMFITPFTTVSTVFLMIAIGRYSISKPTYNAIYEGWTTEIKEG